MCGRFSLTASGETIAQQFDLAEVLDIPKHYNIAPTQAVATIVVDNERKYQPMRWGLIPHWAKDSKIGSRLINARVETVTEKPSFRNLIKQRRCLVIADGYYEWQSQKGRKQPYYFQLGEHQPFAFAGLWDTWRSPDGEIMSCTLLTTDASAEVSPVHHRMPVIVPPQAYSQWLDPNITDPEAVLPLLNSDIYQSLSSYPVSAVVNNPTNNSAECVQPVEE